MQYIVAVCHERGSSDWDKQFEKGEFSAVLSRGFLWNACSFVMFQCSVERNLHGSRTTEADLFASAGESFSWSSERAENLIVVLGLVQGVRGAQWQCDAILCEGDGAVNSTHAERQRSSGSPSAADHRALSKSPRGDAGNCLRCGVRCTTNAYELRARSSSLRCGTERPHT